MCMCIGVRVWGCEDVRVWVVYIAHSILTECRVEADGTCPVLFVNGGRVWGCEGVSGIHCTFYTYWVQSGSWWNTSGVACQWRLSERDSCPSHWTRPTDGLAMATACGGWGRGPQSDWTLQYLERCVCAWGGGGGEVQYGQIRSFHVVWVHDSIYTCIMQCVNTLKGKSLRDIILYLSSCCIY